MKSKQQIKSKMKNSLKLTSKEKSELESKWGFLKNIVNIDRFFAAGGDLTMSKSEMERLAK